MLLMQAIANKQKLLELPIGIENCTDKLNSQELADIDLPKQ